MKKEDILKQARDVISHPAIGIKDIIQANYRVDGSDSKHPYTIGPAHIQKYSIIDDKTCEEIGCAHPKCGLPMSSHHHDSIMIVLIKENIPGNELRDELIKINDLYIGEMPFDGYAFMRENENIEIT